jgi:hypothetical protein
LPIDSAPKDGTHILMLRGEISEAWWQNGQWGGKGWEYPTWDQPTNWMPLPTPPKAMSERG